MSKKYWSHQKIIYFQTGVIFLFAATMWNPPIRADEDANLTHPARKIELSAEHVAAVNRQRQIVVNFDVTWPINISYHRYGDLDKFVNNLFSFTDAEGSQIDSIWWNWGEGNQAPYQSDFLPLFDHPLYKKWVAEGTDIVQIVVDATHQRGKEAFFSHRMNGSDNDLGAFAKIPMKVEHPEWMFRTPWCTHEDNGYWNFALPQVRAHVLRNLREAAERWKFDGIELDFARGVVFPPGEGWRHHEHLTEFVRSLRLMLLDIAARRGQPFLLAARVPETLVGCHFDGIDVETWVREQLVDMLAPSVRNYSVDVIAFRQISPVANFKLYPSIDDHHSSDGYHNPGIEVFRGAVANWFQQGADGVHAFNFNYASNEPYGGQDWQSHLQFYKECGRPETIERKHKTFVLQRRGGGHGPTVIPNPEDWSTPRYWFNNSNMLAPLPALLDHEGKVDTLLSLEVGDDVNALVDQIDQISLKMLLSDPAAASHPDAERIAQAVVSVGARPGGVLHNEPPAQGIERITELRINNILLEPPIIEDGWLLFRNVSPRSLAVGKNLVGVRVVEQRAVDDPRIQIEKIELHVCYKP